MILRFVIFLFCWGINITFSSAQLVFSQNDTELNIGDKINYYADSNHIQNIHTIQHLNFEPNIKSKFSIPYLGLTDIDHWFKFTIKNESYYKKILLALDQPILNHLVLYKVKNGTIDSVFGGESIPVKENLYKYNIPIFEVVDDSSIYYLKIHSIGSLQLDLKLYTSKYFSETKFTKNLLLGIYYGILIVMLLYNLFIFFGVREISYIYYTVYMFVLILTQVSLEGYGNVFIWPNSHWLTEYGTLLFTPLVIVTGILFANKFLNVSKELPWMSKISKVLLILLFTILGITLFYSRALGYNLSRNVLGMSAFYLFILSIVSVKKKIPSAKYFLMSWSALIISIIIFALRDGGVIEHNTFTYYSLSVGTALEVTLLSFALGDKVRIFRLEKEKSQAEAVKIAKLNEKILAEQNIILERQVEDRTKELNKTLSDLKLAQSKLVDNEKMSSLGQLTAGIAHEINNPVNFISSNIKPLSRNFEDLIAIIEKMKNVAEQKNETELLTIYNKFLKDLDFNYMIEETPQLINAIRDGADRTAEIVKGLKTFSRLDEQELSMNNIHDGIDSTLMILRSQLNNITIIKNYNDIPLIECYPGKLNQLFMNTISNAAYAILHSPTPIVDPKIEITTTFDHENLYLSIKDNGPGIPENIINKIFDPFFTTKPVGEGTGLGLSIVYSIIEFHHGQINVESSKENGTVFKFSIPLKQK